MADGFRGSRLGRTRNKSLKRKLSDVLPEWRVLVRRPDGRPQHFALTPKRQLAVLTAGVVMAVWSLGSMAFLQAQPNYLAEKERRLDALIAANQKAQNRMAQTEHLVGEIAHEVDQVHANLVTLTQSSDSLARDQGPLSAQALHRAKATNLADGDDALSQSPEARALRERVRALEESLDRLHVTYTRAVQQAAQSADAKINATERQISRLGLDPDRLMRMKRPGLGGPFIPPPQDDGGSNVELASLLTRMDYWNGVKVMMRGLPVGEPLHDGYDLNSGFGARNDPLNNRTGIHEGVDLGAPPGTPVYATADGVVTIAQAWDRYGNMVQVDHGNGILTRYAHMSRINVREGQRVTRSSVIGLVGSTGRSTGPHLHYEVRISDTPRDPLKFISVGRDAAKNR